MKICTACGAGNPQTAEFCGQCGRHFDAVPPDSLQPSQPGQGEVPSILPNGVPQVPLPGGAIAGGFGVGDAPDAAVPFSSSPFAKGGADSASPAASRPVSARIPPVASPGRADGPQPPFSSPSPSVPHFETDTLMASRPSVPTGATVNGGTNGGANGAAGAAGSTANMFFAWLLDSLKHPSAIQFVPWWWSCLVMFADSLSLSLVCFFAANNVLGSAERGVNNLLGGATEMMTGGWTSGPQIEAPRVGFAGFIRLWIAFSVAVYALVLIAFIGKKMFGSVEIFQQIHHEFARLGVVSVAFNLVLVLFVLLGGTAFALVLLMFEIALAPLKPLFLTARCPDRPKLDTYWTWLLFILVEVLALFVMALLALAIAGTAVLQALL